MNENTDVYPVLYVTNNSCTDTITVFKKMRLILALTYGKKKIKKKILAKVLNMSRQQLYQYEVNNTLPYKEVFVFAKYFDIPLEWLIFKTNDDILKERNIQIFEDLKQYEENLFKLNIKNYLALF